MILQEALDECSICSLFDKNVSDEHKIQLIDKIMSVSSTKIHKVKLCNIITWLLKKIEWQKQQIEKMKCCENCIGNCNSNDMARFCEDNNYKLWEMKE